MFVRALIELLPDEQGNARLRRPTYRPNHNFGGPQDRDFFIGQVKIPEGEELRSGEPKELLVEFLDTPNLEDNLERGREWRIQEGFVLVGQARVLEVLE